MCASLLQQLYEMDASYEETLYEETDKEDKDKPKKRVEVREGSSGQEKFNYTLIPAPYFSGPGSVLVPLHGLGLDLTTVM